MRSLAMAFGFIIALTAALIIWAGNGPGASGEANASVATARKCERPDHVVKIVFSKEKYPHIIKHIKRSWRRGYPKTLQINRVGADKRRDKLLAGYPTKDGFDRDEAPAAVLRDHWRADVMYVNSSENRSAGASLGYQISPYCNGVSVRYKFTR